MSDSRSVGWGFKSLCLHIFVFIYNIFDCSTVHDTRNFSSNEFHHFIYKYDLSPLLKPTNSFVLIKVAIDNRGDNIFYNELIRDIPFTYNTIII